MFLYIRFKALIGNPKKVKHYSHTVNLSETSPPSFSLTAHILKEVDASCSGGYSCLPASPASGWPWGRSYRPVDCLQSASALSR